MSQTSGSLQQTLQALARLYATDASSCTPSAPVEPLAGTDAVNPQSQAPRVAPEASSRHQAPSEQSRTNVLRGAVVQGVAELAPEQVMQSGDALQTLADFLAPLLRDDKSLMALAKYYNDPCSFARDILHIDLAPYQAEILQSIVTRRRVSVRSPHGPGKTACAAAAIIWFAVTRDLAGVDWKVVTTAGGWRQLTQYLWPEVHKWLRGMDWAQVGRTPPNTRFELMDLSLKLRFGKAFGVASDDPELIEGAHADQLLYVLDEAKSISDETFDAVEGAFSGAGESYALMLSTPGKPLGRFYQVQSHKPGYEDWHAKHITLDEALAAGRIRQEYVDARSRQWGIDSAIFQNRVMGNFAATDEDGLVPLAWIEAANERWLDIYGPGSELSELALRELELHVEEDVPLVEYQLTCIGADIAARGEDKTVFALRCGPHIREIRDYAKQDTMATAGLIAGLLKSDNSERLFATVDVNGLGVGVYDRLKEQGLNALPFSGAERTGRVDKTGELGFTNVRSAAWWNLRELLDPSNKDPIALPANDELAGDLTAPTWTVESGGKIKVEPKDHLIVRLGRSPDTGDAVVMAYWNTTANAQVATILSKQSRWAFPEPGHAYVNAERAPAEDGAQTGTLVVGSRWKRNWNR